MTQVKFNRRPFEGSFNNLLDDLFSTAPVFLKNDVNRAWGNSVPVNISENQDGYNIEVVAPGFDKTDFKVNVEENILTISGEKKAEVKSEDKQEKSIRNEYAYRTFKRSFTIDDKIDAAGIDAKYVNGVLTLNLPKKAEVKVPVKEINIQ